jgi:hypothetical protein
MPALSHKWTSWLPTRRRGAADALPAANACLGAPFAAIPDLPRPAPNSLDGVGLLRAQGSCRYFIDVDLLGLSQPTFGFTFEVTSHANYKVYDAGGKSALLAPISGAYTADFAEAPLGSMRLKCANEGAIRTSITQFLDRLRTMK